MTIRVSDRLLLNQYRLLRHLRTRVDAVITIKFHPLRDQANANDG